MKRLLNQHSGLLYYLYRVPLTMWACVLVVISTCFIVDPATANMPKGFDECSKINDPTERLKCYDTLAGRISPQDNTTCPAVSPQSPDFKKVPTYLQEKWDSGNGFPISTYRSNYILPFSYVSSPNEEPIREDNPDKDLKNSEIAYQVSFKALLWPDIIGRKTDLWVTYTQRSFWQFYNFEDSSPFRETNYEPEIILNYQSDFDLKWFWNRFINIGLNHQSNGQSEPLSRSWNRIVANFGFEKNNLSLILKTWWRIPESASDDDNPDIEDYMGYGELWAYYFINPKENRWFWDDSRIGIMVRNNLDFSDNHGALQIEWSVPIFKPGRINAYLHYFGGYGESMLDYNHSINRIGIGFMIRDW